MYRQTQEYLAGELAQEIGFVHVIFEGFAAVDEDNWDFVGELAAELVVAVDVDFLPGESAAAVEFGERFFNDLAQVTPFARVDHDLAKAGHRAECNNSGGVGSSGRTTGRGETARGEFGIVHARLLAPRVKARGFGMTHLKTAANPILHPGTEICEHDTIPIYE